MIFGCSTRAICWTTVWKHPEIIAFSDLSESRKSQLWRPERVKSMDLCNFYRALFTQRVLRLTTPQSEVELGIVFWMYMRGADMGVEGDHHLLPACFRLLVGSRASRRTGKLRRAKFNTAMIRLLFDSGRNIFLIGRKMFWLVRLKKVMGIGLLFKMPFPLVREVEAATNTNDFRTVYRFGK